MRMSGYLFEWVRPMIPDALLIQQPSVDFTAFLGRASHALGFSPSSQADACRRQLHDSEKFLSCLSAMKDQEATVGLSPHLLAHVTFSLLITADERDMLDILEYCSGMPFVAADTCARGIQIAVVTGNLSQWRDATISGCQPQIETSVRMLFNNVVALFESVNLNVWTDCERRPAGRTFLLEDHRSRK